jgi:hypothetical protein
MADKPDRTDQQHTPMTSYRQGGDARDTSPQQLRNATGGADSTHQRAVQPPGREAGKDGDISPGKRHGAAPSMGRKDEPMVTPHAPAATRQAPGPHRNADTGLPPDEDT